MYSPQQQNQNYKYFYPVKQNNERKMTDFCCLALYSLLTFVVILVFFYSYILEKQKNIFQPMDPSGRRCGSGEAQAYPYIYFPSPFYNSLNIAVCIAECPKSSNQKQLKCLPNNLVHECKSNPSNGPSQFLIYQSKINPLLALCQPSSQILQHAINIKIRSHKIFSNLQHLYSARIVIMFVCPSVCIGLMFLYILFISICKQMRAIFLGITFLFFLLMGYLSFFFFLPETKKSFVYAPIIGSLIAVTLILLLVWFISQRNYFIRGLSLASIGAEYIRQNLRLVLVPLSMFTLWAALFIIQITVLVFIYSIASQNSPTASEYNGFPYLINIQNKTLIIILISITFIHYIWTNLILQHMGEYVSRVGAANWIMYVPSHFKNALYTMFKFHIGSVITGSLMITFLSWISELFNMIMPDSNNKLCCCFLPRLSAFYRTQCFRKYFGSHTEITYIRVGLDGQSFNEARYNLTPTIVQNIQYVNQPYKIVKAITQILQLLVAILCTIICYIVIQLSENMKGHFLIYFIIFVISLLLSNFGFDPYNRAFESILLTTIINKTTKRELVERVGISHFANFIPQHLQQDSRMKTYKNISQWFEGEKVLHMEDKSAMSTNIN